MADLSLKTFSKKIKELRTSKGYSMDYFCQLFNEKYKANLNKSTVSRYENMSQEPMISTIKNIADFYGVEVSELLGKTTPEQAPLSQYPFIPDAVAAGIPCTIEGRKDLPTIGISDAIMGKYAGNRHIIVMRVNGESMNKVIPNGSFVAIKTDVSVENLRDGDLVVFGKTHEYSLKHFYNAGDKVIFKPNSTDPTFADHVFDKDETIKIVGKVVLYMVGLV